VPPRDWDFRVRDILGAIAAIIEYTQGYDSRTFAADRRTVDAVIRNLMVIGEAASHVPEDVRSRTTGIPWTEMRALLGNRVHGPSRAGVTAPSAPG